MPGLDLLISSDLSFELKDTLDQNILKKIEKQLFFEHGMSIKLSIEHFEKFREFWETPSISRIFPVRSQNIHFPFFPFQREPKPAQFSRIFSPWDRSISPE